MDRLPELVDRDGAWAVPGTWARRSPYARLSPIPKQFDRPAVNADRRADLVG